MELISTQFAWRVMKPLVRALGLAKSCGSMAGERDPRTSETAHEAGRPVVALNPISSEANSFTGLFSASIHRSEFDLVPFERNHLGRARYDVVVFHWPNEFFRPTSRRNVLKLLARMLLDKLRHGTKFVWVVHNMRPHDSGRPSLAASVFLRLLDGAILLSNHSREELNRSYPSTRSLATLVTVHGRYESFINPPRDQIAAERSNRLLFFGLIRNYKNVERLVAEARKVTSQRFSLRVIGACKDGELKARIQAAAGGDERIVLDIREAIVPDDELERVIDEHDAVVLPYRHILNSGVALHALGRNRPILAPAIGSLPELREMVGAEWVSLFEGDISAEAIEGFLAALAGLDSPRPDLQAFAWERVGSDVTRFLQTLTK
jgi:glycosyltransferase involved in cell wall biosynthesis